MNDLSERDLTEVADEDLTPEERQELHRRMDAFVERMELRRPGKASKPEKPKQITAWTPTVISRQT